MKIIINCPKEKTMQMLEREIKTTAVLTRNVKNWSGNRKWPTCFDVYEIWKYLKANISKEPLINGVINDDNFRIFTLNVLPFTGNRKAYCQRWFLCGTVSEESGKTVLQAKMKMEHRHKLWECIVTVFLVLYTVWLIAAIRDVIILLCMYGSLWALAFLPGILMKKCIEQMIIKDINHIFADFGTTVSRK